MRVMWDGKGGRGEASASLIWTERWMVVPLTNEEQIKGCLTRGGEGEHLRAASWGCFIVVVINRGKILPLRIFGNVWRCFLVVTTGGGGVWGGGANGASSG